MDEGCTQLQYTRYSISCELLIIYLYFMQERDFGTLIVLQAVKQAVQKGYDLFCEYKGFDNGLAPVFSGSPMKSSPMRAASPAKSPMRAVSPKKSPGRMKRKSQ